MTSNGSTQQISKQAQKLTRDATQYETKRDFSKSKHSKQNKRFLAIATSLNTNETSKYTYKLLLTSTDRLLLSKIIYLHSLLLALEHTFLFITRNGQASADTDKRRNRVRDQTRLPIIAFLDTNEFVRTSQIQLRKDKGPRDFLESGWDQREWIRELDSLGV